MTSTILPNAFQSPNTYVDIAMELLTGEEYKCLSFASRHILGWQDKINERRGVISFTMFEHGYDSKYGTHFGGTGLSRRAIQRALEDGLVKYNLLTKLKLTAKGQEYEINESPNWDGLRQRLIDKQQKNVSRTKSARKKRVDKASNPAVAVSPTNHVAVSPTLPYLVSPTNRDAVSPTNQSQLVPLTESKPYTKPMENHKEKEIEQPSDPEAAKQLAESMFKDILKSKTPPVDPNVGIHYSDADIADQTRRALEKYASKEVEHGS